MIILAHTQEVLCVWSVCVSTIRGYEAILSQTHFKLNVFSVPDANNC